MKEGLPLPDQTFFRDFGQDMLISVTSADGGSTIKDFLRRMGASRRIVNRMKQMENGILLNGERVTVRAVLSEGDTLALAMEDDRPAEPETAVGIPIARSDFASSGVKIIYEDGDLIAFSKPAGMPTHISHGHLTDSLLNAAAGLFYERGEPFVFRPVNRLDRDTSGIVLAAKNQLTAFRMSKRLQSGDVRKRYRAVLTGVIDPPGGTIESYIRRRESSLIERISADSGIESEHAVTVYETVRVSASKDRCAVDCSPVTGRTHQLRVHFMSKGHPIVGDTLYGTPSEEIPRQALHAFELIFPHPTTGETVIIRDDIPGEIEKLC